ncbi:MAG: 16S rRNA processing protein RimM, partial [Rhodothermales bacterium]|nr:16S rRNA processing protein RimM [Rhodothermales bacterium]
MPSVSADSLLLVGVCGRPHGVRGEVKVFPETDDPERLLDL